MYHVRETIFKRYFHNLPSGGFKKSRDSWKHWHNGSNMELSEVAKDIIDQVAGQSCFGKEVHAL